MIYGYIRVSSDKQTIENQRFEINNFCEHQNLSIDDWIEETISGTKNYTKRQLGNLLKKVNKDDIIICSELSRLGRNLFMIMEILNICMTKECRVWTIKDNYRLGDDIQSKVLAFAFGLSAEIERNLISQRTKEALARKKAEGVVLGRRKGSKNKKHKLDNKEMLIKKSLERGISKTDLAHKLKVSRNTLYLFLQRTNLSDIIRGQTAEIRCTLKRDGEFADTRYTIRYFQSDGKGLLRNDNGTVFKPNDRYPLTKDVFRLYYTSLSADRQTIDVYVEDSFGKVQQLTFSFNNEREEGKDKPASSRH